MRAETISFEGPAAAWDPDNRGPFAALAGGAFLWQTDGNAVVLTADGHEQVIYPGWLVVVPESGRPLFFAPDKVRVTA